MRKALAILTLGLGIGAATAMFSFVHPMLLHPLLYPHPDRLVVIQVRDSKGRPGGSSWPEVRDYARVPLFSNVAAFDIGFFFLTGVDEPEQIAGALVTPNLFHTLGVRPSLGRTFREGEQNVVILSDACWKDRFGADPRILGRTIALDFARTPEAEHYTVVGVMPPDFWMYYSGFEVFVPLPHSSMSEDRKARGLAAFARLRNGVTLEQARNAINAIPLDKDLRANITLWEESQTQDVRSSFLVVAVGAGLLLLIATANVAGLLLVGTQGRLREIAIRAALGASPWRLIRLIARESFHLGVSASGVGVTLAWWGLRIIIASLPHGGLFSFLPSLDRVVIDWPVLFFAIGASACACVLSGIFPAMAIRNVDLVTALKNGASSDSPRARKILVTAELALCVSLLASAGLLVRTMQRIDAIDPGFRPDHLLTLRVPVPRSTDQGQAETYYRELLERLDALPGVQSVALASKQPLTGMPQPERFDIPGRSDAEADIRVVSPGYFMTLGIPILQGRALDPRDNHRAVISESLARRYWNGENPIGKSIRLHGESIGIVGVCGDTRDVLLREAAPILYRSWRDAPDRAQQLDVRTSGRPLALTRDVSRVVRDLGGVAAEVHAASQFIEDVTWQQKLAARLASAFAGLALVLAMVGLFSVVSLAIRNRTRQIGVRLAIGARSTDILSLVLGECAGPVLAGLALGLSAAEVANRLLKSMLYGVAPSDPLVLAFVVAITIIATIFACLAPLRRALRVDPAISLRCE